MSEKETLVIVISRHELDPSLIPPLKIIIPMLSNLFPVEVHTSYDGKLKPKKGVTLYQELVNRLENTSGSCCMGRVLKTILE